MKARSWRELIATEADGSVEITDLLDGFGRYVDAWNGDKPVGIEGYFLSFPGEEPNWDTPHSPVDWTGFRNAVTEATNGAD